MNRGFWKKFSSARRIRCVEMKNKVQDRIVRETREMSQDGLIEYFGEASRRFWREMGRAYPEAAATPAALRAGKAGAS